MEEVEIKRHDRFSGKAMTIDQQKEFIKVIENRKLNFMYMTYLSTGARQSELLNLTWTDINYENKSIRIPGTKTENAERHIPLFPILQSIFEQIPHTHERIFPISLKTLKRDFTEVKKLLTFPLKLHELRHTFATRCKENGIEDRIIQKWLGHADIKTTTKIYMHVLGEFEQQQALKFAPSFAPSFLNISKISPLNEP